MNLDEKAKKVFGEFQYKLKFYHPPQEMLLLYGLQPRMLYNNICERRMRKVKELARKMGGFKKLETAQKIVDAIWAQQKFLPKSTESC